MDVKTWLKKEKILWHGHFVTAFVAAVCVGILSFIYEMTISNIVLFASIGASATMLIHAETHHHSRLRTTLEAYTIAIIISSFIYSLNVLFNLHISINLFLLILLVTLGLFLFNAFHPPAITASLSFILLERPLIDLVYLFLEIMLLLFVIRLIHYLISNRLPIKRFIHNELKRHELQ